MANVSGEHLSVAKALYQLKFYLRQLDVQTTVKDLYEAAYKTRRGELYDDRWLDCLEENPEVLGSEDEPFTTQSIVEILMRTGHEPVVRALMKSIRREKIGFSQLYMIASTPRRRP
jgi:hypothetical protein